MLQTPDHQLLHTAHVRSTRGQQQLQHTGELKKTKCTENSPDPWQANSSRKRAVKRDAISPPRAPHPTAGTQGLPWLSR